jgi:non-canonical (house-cleaning) NTP pyrophosphatase
MKLGIGTKSERKVKTIRRSIEQLLAVSDIETHPFPSKSGVPETPWDKESYDGARNRAIDCQKNVPGLDFYIGLESGLVERYGHIFEEAWCCLINNEGKEYFGYSSGLKFLTLY